MTVSILPLPTPTQLHSHELIDYFRNSSTLVIVVNQSAGVRARPLADVIKRKHEPNIIDCVLLRV